MGLDAICCICLHTCNGLILSRCIEVHPFCQTVIFRELVGESAPQTEFVAGYIGLDCDNLLGRGLCWLEGREGLLRCGLWAWA